MANRQNKTQAKSKSRLDAATAEARASELQARAELEQQRHGQLCQLLALTLPNPCDDYLRQLATTAVQSRAMTEIATLQAQLLQERKAAAQAAAAPQPSAEGSSTGAFWGDHFSSLFGKI